MIYSKIPAAQTVVRYCKTKGIHDIVISPGSRNAPLTIGFSEDPFFNCFSIVDERSAAFFALGMSQQQQKPVALVCTSGSALLNYYPAIAEAYYSDIPLIIISADRPGYRIDRGDGQTIRQNNVFANHIGYQTNLKLDVWHARKKIEKFAPELLKFSQPDVQQYNSKEVHKALQIAIETNTPVHVNVPFEEPLYDKVSHQTIEVLKEKGQSAISRKEIDFRKLANVWSASKKKMVLVGVLTPNSLESEVVEYLANDPSVLVFTETTSNLHHPNFFQSIDSIIFPIEKSTERDALFQDLRPEVLLTFGGMIVSKKIKSFLRNYKPKHHWHIDEKKAYDTFFSGVKHIEQSPNEFLKSFLGHTELVKSDYCLEWSSVKKIYEERREKYINKIAFSDFWVYAKSIKAIPKNYQLHFANSSAIRYSQLFEADKTHKIFCNRGTSGIDGSISTAVGASVYEDNPTLLITGDLSFFYDSNAFWNSAIKTDFRVIIINNGGGGIFRILPGKENSENFRKFFETRHGLNAKSIAQMHSFDYYSVQNKVELEEVLGSFFEKNQKPSILEVFTPADINDQILLDYFDFISSKA